MTRNFFLNQAIASGERMQAAMNQIALTDFPGFPAGYQFRRQLCKEFERLLENAGDSQTLIIEARPGIGATSLCAEYFSTVEEPAILLCVHAGSRAGYSLPFLLEQGIRQARALLGEPHATPPTEAPTTEWQGAMLRLIRKARSNRQRIHFIVDGLYQVPKEDERYVHDILRNVLLIGNPNILHLLTWSERAQLPSSLNNKPPRHTPIPPLMEPEATAFLQNCNLTDNQLREVLRCTGCVPAKLASVARIIKLGKFEELKIQGALEGYYDIEWDALIHTNASLASQPEIARIFAFIVFSKKPLNALELQRYTEIQKETIRKIAEGSSFLTLDECGSLYPASNTHRDFLARVLEKYRTEVLQRFVDLLATCATSEESLQLLPTYFEELGRDQDVIAFLTPTNLDGYLQSTQSLTALRRRNELGLSAANRTKKELEEYRFALQNSIVRTLESYGRGKARLGALAAVGRLEEALAAALSEPTKEGRLILLSEYASALHERKLQIDQVLAQTIRTLLDDVDLDGDTGRAITIAENLIGSLPDLSIEVVERATRGVQLQQDATLTQLALKHQISPQHGTTEAAQSYRSRISDNKLQSFLWAAEAIFGTKSAEDIKQSTESLGGKQRFFFLRQWVRIHSSHEKALEIANHALDEVSRDSSYLPAPADLRDICLPVAHNATHKLADVVLSRVEIQRSALLEASPTIDMLRLDLEIARARVSLAKQTNEDVLSEIYLKTGHVTDDGVRLECFCWMRSALKRFSLSDEERQTYSKLLDQSIQESTEKCLATTAEHIHVFRGSVAALCESSPTQALELVAKLNTADRRDEAYEIFIDKLLSRRTPQPIDASLVHQALSRITSLKAKSRATTRCIELLSKNKPPISGDALSLAKRLKAIDDPILRAKGVVSAISVEYHYVGKCNLSDAATEFNSALEQIDFPWMISDLNYEFVEASAKIDKTFASEFLDAFQRNSSTQLPISQHLARLTFDLAQLSIVSFCALLQHRLDDEESYKKARSIVDDCPSLLVRTRLFADIAVRASISRRGDILERVCLERLMPAIRNSESGSPHLHRELIASSYSALYLWKESAAEALLAALEEDVRDDKRHEVIRIYVTRTSSLEPHDDLSFRSARIDYADALSILELIERMVTDSILVFAIQTFVSATLARASVSQISHSQRGALAAKLLDKVTRSLPQVRNVNHNGWKIVATAYCYRLSGEPSQQKWEDLLREARIVPNTSDRVYVLACVAPCLPPKLANERAKAIHDAETQLDQIPSRIDSIRRAISISSTATEGLETDLAKKILRNALKASLMLKEKEDVTQVHQGIIDQAYQIDPDFAEELLSQIDDDPARINARQASQQALEFQKARGAVRDRRYAEIDEDILDLGPIFWQSLSGLNSSRIPAHRPAEAAALFGRASQLDLASSQRFYWWYLRNAQNKCEHSKMQSNVLLPPLFEVTTLAAALSTKVCSRVARRTPGFSKSHTKSDGNRLVGGGDDQPALEFVRAWMERTAPQEVWICDPYFSADCLDFIKELCFAHDGIAFTVIACSNSLSNSNLQAEYERSWAQIAHVEPPQLRALHVFYDGERTKSPIHDRWILGDQKCGIRIGGSINGLASLKLSEISEMQEDEVPPVCESLSPFVTMRERTLLGKRLRYQVVQW
jgi:hypothetical protein